MFKENMKKIRSKVRKIIIKKVKKYKKNLSEISQTLYGKISAGYIVQGKKKF